MMTQYPNDPYQPQPGAPDSMVYEQQNQKTSGLAIASLICSLIFCCPVTTLLGIVLGLIAAISVNRSPMLRGMGLAIAAIILGVIFTVGQFLVGRWGWEVAVVPVMQGPIPALEAGYDGDYDAFRARMTQPASQASDAEIEAFINELTERYGSLVEGEIGPQGPQPDPQGRSQAIVPYLLQFSDAGTVNAEAEIIYVDQQTGQLVMKPSIIRIIDADRGDLVFPPGATMGGGATNGADADVDGADPEGEIGAEAPPEGGVGEANDGPPQPE